VKTAELRHPTSTDRIRPFADISLRPLPGSELRVQNAMMKVVHYDSPHAARDNTREYLSRDPLRNTVILTLLESRIADSLPGRYWAAISKVSP
jgi:hypothetical protein